MDGVPVAQDGEALDVEYGELPGLVEGERVAREGGDAQPGENGLLDRFVAAEFQARVDVEAVPAEYALDGVARTPPLLPHQPRLRGDAVERDLLAVRERMIRCCQHDDGVVHDGRGDDVDVLRRL